MRFQTWSRSFNPIQGKCGVCHCTSTMLNYRYLSSVLLILRNRRKPWDASGKKFVLVMLWDVPLVGLLSGLLNIIKSMCESTRHVICHDKSRVMFSLQRTHEYDRTPQHTALFVLAAHVFTPTYHISYCSLWKMGTTEVKSTVSCMLTSRNYRYTIHRWFWSFIIIPTAEVIAVSSMSTLLKGALCSIALPGGPGEKYFDG